MQKALRGGDSPAILILSININGPVATGPRQGFPESMDTSFAGRHGVTLSARHNWNDSENRQRCAARIR